MRGPRTEPGGQTADVNPVSPHHSEAHQLVLEERRRVEHHIVQVLTGRGLMVVDQHVAGVEAIDPVAGDAVLDHHAEVGDEV